jgi:exodeoxyribonuclease VII small subunit
MTAKKNSKDSLEHSLERLEEIVGALEQGSVSLDESMNLYEEGIRISKECG